MDINHHEKQNTFFSLTLQVQIIICFDQLFFSMETASSIPELIVRINDTKNKLSRVVSADDSTECCFCVGLTGAGKSTFICHMCGAELTHERKNGKFIFSHANAQLPKIGNTNAACTTIPGFYTTRNGTILYDAPGFLATTGVIQEILDSYCNAKMFRVGSRAKMIIVVEWFTLYSGRSGGLMEVAFKLQQLFGDDFHKVINSCILIVTKVNENFTSIEQIKGAIADLGRDNVDLAPQARMLIETLLNQRRILSFPVPQQINDEVIDQILTTVDNLTGFAVVNQPRVALSAKSINLIEQLVSHIQKEKYTLTEHLSLQIVDTFKKNMKSKAILQESLLKIKSARTMILNGELESGIPEKLVRIQTLLSLNDNSVQKIKDWMSQIQFCANIHPQLRLSKNSKADPLVFKLTELESDFERQLDAISTKEEIQKMNKQHNQSIQQQTNAFRSDLEAMRKSDGEKYQKLRKDAEAKNSEYLSKIQANNKAHMEYMNKLNVEIENNRKHQENIALLNKEITELKEKNSERPCEIM